MSRYVELSKHFVETILAHQAEPTAEGLAELFEIKSGNKEILLEHLKAITNIMNHAIKELEEKNKNGTKN